MFFNFFGNKKSIEESGIEFSFIDTSFCDLYSQMYNSEKTVNTIAVFERHELARNAEVENIFVEIMKFLSKGFKTINEITNMCENNLYLLKYYDALKNSFENLYIGNSNNTIYAVKEGIFADSEWLSIIEKNCIDEVECYLFKEINRDITSFSDIGNIITNVPCDMHFIMDILRGALTISYSNEFDTNIIIEQIKKVCEKYKKPLFNEREIYR